MIERRESFNEQPASWTWHVMPLLIVVAAVSALFMPPAGAGAGATAAESMSAEMPLLYSLVVPSPQPGEGEPAPATRDVATY